MNTLPSPSEMDWEIASLKERVARLEEDQSKRAEIDRIAVSIHRGSLRKGRPEVPIGSQSSGPFPPRNEPQQPQESTSSLRLEAQQPIVAEPESSPAETGRVPSVQFGPFDEFARGSRSISEIAAASKSE